jgi:hypothetical protein
MTPYHGHSARRMVVFAPLLLASRRREVPAPGRPDLVLDPTVIATAASRLITGALPFSGHLSLPVDALAGARAPLVRLAALVLSLHATFVELVLRGDPVTWAIGGAGLAPAALRPRPWRRRDDP